MGCAASTASADDSKRRTRPLGASSPEPPPTESPSPKRQSIAGRRSSAVERIVANTDLTDEEKAQLERIAKNRPPQNTLSTEENSLARYEVVTFGIKDEAYYNSSGIVVVERSKSTASSGDESESANSGKPPQLVRKQSIIRQPAAAADAEAGEPAAMGELSASPTDNFSPSPLSRSASKKAVKFTGPV